MNRQKRSLKIDGRESLLLEPLSVMFINSAPCALIGNLTTKVPRSTPITITRVLRKNEVFKRLSLLNLAIVAPVAHAHSGPQTMTVLVEQSFV
jgi:hypothetical protein